MDRKFQAALNSLCSGESRAAIVTIIDVKGSTPRKPGAKMLVLPDGQTVGTIGGGCGEAQVRLEALRALDENTSRVYHVNMTGELAEEEGMVCGGIMEVLIDVPSEESRKDLLVQYYSALGQGREPVLVTLVSPQPSKQLFVLADSTAAGDLGDGELNKAALALVTECRIKGKNQLHKLPNTEHTLFVELPPFQVDLVILGGGHIALPLATMAKQVGYTVTVLDDRPGFANPGRFPTADRIICAEFSKGIAGLDIGPNSFVVIITRGHRHDKVCLQQVVNSDAAYVGMIGSRRRVKALLAELENEGVERERLNRVYSPIGLDIGAETPEEIAVCILAQLIQVQRRGGAKS